MYWRSGQFSHLHAVVFLTDLNPVSSNVRVTQEKLLSHMQVLVSDVSLADLEACLL